MEVVTCHVSAFGSSPALATPAPPRPRPGVSPSPKGRRRVDFDADGVHETVAYDRVALPAGFRASGPLVVEDETTTALVPPGQTLEVDEGGNLVLWLR